MSGDFDTLRRLARDLAEMIGAALIAIVLCYGVIKAFEWLVGTR